MIDSISRREFIQLTAAGLGSLAIPFSPKVFSRDLDQDPHFFIQVWINGGVDQSYMFDARPLELTNAKMLQNYLGVEPSQMTGTNGQTCFRTSITDPLKEFQSEMSILNGVVMAHGFDGHIENTRYLLSGNPFGGAGYLAHLNQFGPKLPLDTIATSQFALPQGINNAGQTLVLGAANARALVSQIKTGTAIDESNPWVKYAQGRQAAIGKGSGKFATGSRNMLAAYRSAPRLANAMKEIELGTAPAANTPETDQFLPIISEVFRHGVAHSVLLSYGDELQLDVHAPADAKNVKDKYSKVIDRIVKLFRHLKNTPYDSNRSLFDMTTILVSSEFTRTMRQEAQSIEETGTDHNSHANSVWLFGRGIKPGLILGSSDFQVSSETLSGAHAQMDPKKLKIMGRPFEFSSLRSRVDLPSNFQITDYLTFNSIANTIYSLFNVPTTNYRTLGRDLPVAPLLPGLLK